jgi:IS605 OrfB family transposase
MKLTVQVKLIPDAEQRAALLATVERINLACDYASERAWQTETFRQYDLQALVYRDLRERFGLAAQATIRAIAKVADAYKLDRKTQRVFRPRGAVAYDSRILRWYDSSVSIWSTAGRLRIPFACGERQRAMLAGKRGETDLIWRDGCFFLHCSVEVAEEPVTISSDFLGVDLGIVQIAVDSDGEAHSGATTAKARHRVARLRKALQSKGTKSAKRHLRKLRRKERRFHRHTNHCISKHIVRKAKGTGRGIAVEDLDGIRDRVTVRKAQRSALHSWSFFELRQFLAYKSRLAGVALVAVDPRNTSRTCPECGCVDKANRRAQAEFVCTGCGFAANADWVGARNIAARARVTAPIVATAGLGNGIHSEHLGSGQLQSPAL